MPLFRKNRPAKTTNSPLPAGRDDQSSMVPQTRFFFVFDEMPEDSPPAQRAERAEQTYREAVENAVDDAVDSLLQQTQAAASAPYNDANNESPAHPADATAQSISAFGASTPERPYEREPEYAEITAEPVPAATSTAPQPSPDNRTQREQPAHAPATPTQQPQDTRRSTQRLHVRRELNWDDGTSDEHRS